TIVKRWHRAYSSITLIARDRFRDRRAQARLRRRHRLLLRRGVRQIVAFLDFLGFRDLAGLVVDNDFRVLALARRVRGKLQRSVLHLEFRGDRLAALLSSAKAFLQRDLRTLKRFPVNLVILRSRHTAAEHETTGSDQSLDKQFPSHEILHFCIQHDSTAMVRACRTRFRTTAAKEGGIKLLTGKPGVCGCPDGGNSKVFTTAASIARC